MGTTDMGRIKLTNENINMQEFPIIGADQQEQGNEIQFNVHIMGREY